jgi:hypothetical protein
MIDDSLRVVQIRKWNLHRDLGVVTHATRTLSNAGQALKRLIETSK